jgi:hypothetical protein
VCPQENYILFFNLSRLFLVASENPPFRVGEKPISDIHWFPSLSMEREAENNLWVKSEQNY